MPRIEHRPSSLGIAFAASLTLSCLIASSGARSPEPAGMQPPNPHWRRDSCQHCHADPDADELAIPGEEVTAMCMACHDGVKAPMERHPVGRPAKSSRAAAPADWPTPGDKLSCVTCHDPTLSGEHSSQGRGDNPKFLRGGRPATLVSFCGNCHAPAEHARSNPHQMISPDGSILDDRCSFCHLKSHISNLKSEISNMKSEISDPAPAARGASRTGDPRLVSDEITLCAGCHGRHVDYFEPGHIGARMPVEMLARRGEPPAVKSSPAPGSLLPLAHGDTVTCSSCHNPHQRGVFPPDSTPASGAISFEERGDRPPLRLPPSALCSACHFP